MTGNNINKFSRIQNLHISQTRGKEAEFQEVFSRIQNLHISQTRTCVYLSIVCLVEFKIYISLKQGEWNNEPKFSLVEFKIYISLKQHYLH